MEIFFLCKMKIFYIEKNVKCVFPGGTKVKNLLANAADARDTGSIPGSGRFPEGGYGNPRQYSCLENSIDRGAWWATVHGITKSQTRLSTHTDTDNENMAKRKRHDVSNILFSPRGEFPWAIMIILIRYSQKKSLFYNLLNPFIWINTSSLSI